MTLQSLAAHSSTLVSNSMSVPQRSMRANGCNQSDSQYFVRCVSCVFVCCSMGKFSRVLGFGLSVANPSSAAAVAGHHSGTLLLAPEQLRLNFV